MSTLSSGNGPRCLDLTAVDGEITDRFGDVSSFHGKRPSKQRRTDPLFSLPVPISEVLVNTDPIFFGDYFKSVLKYEKLKSK